MREVVAMMPRDLSDITLEQYQKYEKVLEQNKDAEQERFVQLKMIEIFCGVNYEDATKLRLQDFETLVTGLYAVLNEKPPFVHSFFLGDTEFGFIPDLENMTFGEFVDLESYLNDMQNLEKAMAVLYRPIKQRIKDKYLIHEYEGDMFHEAMKQTPMNAVTSSMLFFWNLGIDCLIATLKSSPVVEDQREARQLLLKRKALIKNGGGTLQYTNSLATILQDLNQSRNLE